MGNRTNRTQPPIIDPSKFGVSFSTLQCRNFELDTKSTLTFLIEDVGLRRFRLMSYWNEIEKTQGKFDFKELDQQVELISKYNGVITMCLGVRQPRWPESHYPDWALGLETSNRDSLLLYFIETVVKRYKNNRAIISWQLENEALNRSFGLNGDFNRKRLRSEFKLVQKMDDSRPLIMSTSNTWGIPIRKPRPNLFGFTFYTVQFEKGAYSRTKLPFWWWNFRAKLIRCITFRKSFIHELQAEPWGPKAIWEMSISEQDKSMNVNQLKKNLDLARKTKLYPIDLWGSEWWYWRKLQGDDTLWQTIKTQLTN